MVCFLMCTFPLITLICNGIISKLGLNIVQPMMFCFTRFGYRPSYMLSLEEIGLMNYKL